MLTIRHARAREDWNDKNLGQKGFTLVELLVVIIILGILAAVVVIAVNSFQDRGRENACITERRTIETAAAAYYAANDNTWPGDSSDLLTPPTGQTAYIKTPEYTWDIDTTDGHATNTSTSPPCP